MSKKFLLLLTFFLVAVNSVVIAQFSTDERRLVRLCSVIIFFIFYLIFKGFVKNKPIFLVLITFILTDILGFYFEDPIAGKLIYVIRIIGYLILIKTVLSKVNLLKIKPIVLGIFTVVILLNLYLLYTLLESATSRDGDSIEYFLILIYGVTTVILAIMSVNYNLRYGSTRSTFFLYCVLAIILSDLSWFIAYFFNYQAVFYADVAFYFLGLFCLINYAINTSEADDVLLLDE